MSYRTDYYLNIAEGGPGHAEVAGKLAERAELSAFQSRGSAKDWEPVITGSCLRWTRKTGQLVKWESCS